ncbi:hypothetical protein CLNEO_20270 [Anaerotignum neopropionicum]|uniref:Uncharacterized protein n=1 Tax=Anaerotignum neopropionicum TaxID=36847 RepID=A0A136WDM6_9FIRM|nr:hypothetical protein [Anaerotignum neopropionicum]KXL52618.1 hypothetical protein CLNEO_20270 [Anaerotignum neopropionicum]
MSKNGNIREMSKEDRGTILKKHIVIYELLITALQIAIIIFCFLAYKKVDAVYVEGLGLSLLDSSLGYVMCIFAFAVFTMCISLIRFSMLLVPWFRELWKDAWKDDSQKKNPLKAIQAIQIKANSLWLR